MTVPLVALLATVWLGILVAAPTLPIPIAGALYALGSHICHQRAERSFHLFAAQLPVCARCTGIYAGAAVAASACALNARLRGYVRRWSARPMLLVGALPTAGTLVFEWTGIWVGSNVGRAVAGLALGAAVALVVVQASLRYTTSHARNDGRS